MLWFAAATVLAAALLYWWLRSSEANPSTTTTQSLTGLRDLEILYGDNDGVITSRLVTLTAVEYDRETGQALKFEGFCHLRRAKRNFLPKRVLEMKDIATGERIADVDSFLARWSHQNRQM